MKSLRARLFVLLAAITVIVWSAAAVWAYVHTKSEIQRVLDRRLMEAAGMVASLAQDTAGDLGRSASKARLIPLPRYSRQLSCQIWTLDGRLVGRSSGAPNEPLATFGSGFSERNISGESWRVYTISDPKGGIRVSVGDNLRVRQRLIGDLMLGLLLPAIAGVIALSFLIWAAVGAGLSPLREVAQRLHGRDPSDFTPLGIDRPTRELGPLIGAIDTQFEKLGQVRATERHFLASAAHELQTPLAGLRAHAQIALTTVDEHVRRKSLRSIETSVDRTARLVQQLLDLAREEGIVARTASRWVRLSDVMSAVGDEFAHALRKQDVRLTINQSAALLEIFVDEGNLLLALRNLVKNAIDQSPSGSAVEIVGEHTDDEVGIAVIDQGSGIPVGEIDKVRERFVRGSQARGVGSGLGLSIVDLVLGHAGSRLALVNEPGRGLRATMVFAKQRIRERSA